MNLLLRFASTYKGSRMARMIAGVFCLQMLGRLLLGVSLLAIVRWLPKPDYAAFTAAYAVMMLTSNVWTGFCDGLTRELSEHLGAGRVAEANHSYLDQARGQALVLVLLSVVLVVFATPLARLLYGNSIFGPAVAVGILAGSVAALNQTLAVYYQAGMRFNRYVSINNARHAIMAIGALSLGWSGHLGLKSALLLLLLSGVLPLMAGALDISRELGGISAVLGRPRLHLAMFGSKWQIMAYFWMVWAGFQFPLMALGHLSKDTSDLADFGVVWRLYSLAIMITGTIDQVLLPWLARDAGGTQQRRIFDRWIRFAGPVVLVFLPLVWLMVPTVFRWLFGIRYEGTILPFQVLVPAIAVCYLLAPVNMLLPQKDFRVLIISGLYHLGIIVFLCLLLIPWFGVLGASIALGASSLTHVLGAWKSWINMRNGVSGAS